jgi:hypothetical protein
MSERKKVNFYDLTVHDLINMNKTLRNSILDRIRRVGEEDEEQVHGPDPGLVHSQTIDGKFLEIILPPEAFG